MPATATVQELRHNEQLSLDSLFTPTPLKHETRTNYGHCSASWLWDSENLGSDEGRGTCLLHSLQGLLLHLQPCDKQRAIAQRT